MSAIKTKMPDGSGNHPPGGSASNRLPVLLATLKNASVVFAKAERMSAEAAYDMGVALVEAKELCAHGEWGEFLEQAGVTPRSAQRYMRIVKAGMDRNYVALVGLSAALEEIDDAQAIMPDGGSATMAAFGPREAPSILMWWRVSQYKAGLVQTYKARASDDHARCLIVESFPLYLAGFIYSWHVIECRDSHPELWRRQISFRERDEKIEFLRSEILAYEQARQAEHALTERGCNG